MSTRLRRAVAVSFVTLLSVAWGASASAAPQSHHSPGRHPILISHLMSSCGHMDRL